MKIKFQLETSFRPFKNAKQEPVQFTCELSDPEKIQRLEKSLSQEIDELTKIREIILFAIKNGQCHFKFRSAGAVVFYNHDFFIIDNKSAIFIVFPRGEDVIFKCDLEQYLTKKNSVVLP